MDAANSVMPSTPSFASEAPSTSIENEDSSPSIASEAPSPAANELITTPPDVITPQVRTRAYDPEVHVSSR